MCYLLTLQGTFSHLRCPGLRSSRPIVSPCMCDQSTAEKTLDIVNLENLLRHCILAIFLLYGSRG